MLLLITQANVGHSNAISNCSLIPLLGNNLFYLLTEMGDDGAAAMNIEAKGPILLSTTEVNRTFVFQELRQTVEQLRGVGAIR